MIFYSSEYAGFKVITEEGVVTYKEHFTVYDFSLN